MSAYLPPTYYFTGIDFNAAFFKSDTIGISEARANSLYLLKNSPDTATAIETFSGGINTASVNVATSGSGMNVATGSIAGTINIATSATRSGAMNINTGASSTSLINIGSSTTNIILNGLVTTTDIKSLNYDGLNSAANIDICKSTTSGAITLGKLSASSISIGASGSTTNINGAANLARNTAGTNPTYIECFSTITTSVMDFHANSANAVDYDARISCSGGTATLGNGDLAVTSKSFTLSSPLTLGTAATSNAMLGWTAKQDITASFTLGSAQVIASQSISTAGVYIVNWGFQYLNSTSVTYLFTNICNGAAATTVAPTVFTTGNWGNASLGSVGGNPYQSSGGTVVVTASAGTYINLVLNTLGGTSLTAGTFLQVTRIG